MATAVVDDIAWIDASQGYQIGLRNGKVVCRNPQGKTLASLPKWLKEDEATERLGELADWLAERQVECRLTVERWMLRSLIVPRDVLTEIWIDPDWRSAMQNLAIAPADAKGAVNRESSGLLRDVDAKRGLGIVNLDGESQWLKSPAFAVLHPILIPDLAELRELASDLGVEQAVEQLYRPVFQPTEKQKGAKSIQDYSGGIFDQLNFVTSLCKRLGYPVRGGYATCRVWESEAPLEARFWVGADYPEGETETGELLFVDSKQQPVRIADVGPVTFSEGVRMATAVYAKRKVEKTEEDQR